MKTYDAVGILDKYNKKIIIHVALAHNDFNAYKWINLTTPHLNGLLVVIKRPRNNNNDSGKSPKYYLNTEKNFADIDNTQGRPIFSHAHKGLRLAILHEENFTPEMQDAIYKCFSQITDPKEFYDLNLKQCHAFGPETTKESILVAL